MAANSRMMIWLSLRGAREAAAGLAAVARENDVLGRGVNRLAANMERGARKTWLMNQALFTMRRYSYMATLALTAGIVLVGKWGFDYNKQVQTARVALGLFLPGQQAVNAEISKLYRIAAVTPFLFTDITTTARRFLAFGMTLDQTNRTIVNVTDALSALGITSGAALNRASLALGHMMSLGRLTGQIVYQLARDNIPIIQALETELGLTGEQLRHVGALGISASVALGALNKYIEGSRYHGAGERLGLSTLAGIVTTLRDFAAQGIGNLMTKQFDSLYLVARKFYEFQAGVGKQGRLSGGLAGFVGAWDPRVGKMVGMLLSDFHALVNILVHGAIPAFIRVWSILAGPFYLALWTTSQILQFLGHHTLLVKIFFGILAAEIAIVATRFIFLLPLMIASNAVMIAGAGIVRVLTALGILRIAVIEGETAAETTRSIVMGRSLLFFRGLAGAMKLNILLTKANVFWTRLWTAATKGYVVGAGGQFVRLTRLEKLLLAARRATIAYTVALWGATRAMIAFLFTNPIGWAILLIGVMTILYLKWDRFHEVVNKVFHAIWSGSPGLSAALAVAFGPIGQALLAIREIYAIYRAIRGVFSFFGGGTNSGAVPLALQRNSLRGPSGMANLAAPGHALDVPTRSPIATNKIGTSNSSITPGLMPPIHLHHTTTLNADGKKLAEVVSEHRLDSSARR